MNTPGKFVQEFLIVGFHEFFILLGTEHDRRIVTEHDAPFVIIGPVGCVVVAFPDGFFPLFHPGNIRIDNQLQKLMNQVRTVIESVKNVVSPKQVRHVERPLEIGMIDLNDLLQTSIPPENFLIIRCCFE